MNQIPEVWPLTEQAAEPELDGYIEDLERVAFADGPGPAYWPILEPQPALERETVQTFRKSEPGAPTIDKGANTWVTDGNDLEQFPELAHVLRTELTRLEAQRTRRSHRREARRLDREGDGYERRNDGVRVSPAAFLRSELRGVSGMGFSEMIRRWKAMGASGTGRPRTYNARRTHPNP